MSLLKKALTSLNKMTWKTIIKYLTRQKIRLKIKMNSVRDKTESQDSSVKNLKSGFKNFKMLKMKEMTLKEGYITKRMKTS